MSTAAPAAIPGLDPTPRAGRYEPLAGAVARHLRDAIYDGTLQPGAPIRQEAVARELGTSRIPVREALRRLEVEGLVSIVPHSGARVATLDFEECLEVYAIRERIEPLAFAQGAGRLEPEQLAHVRRLAGEIESGVGDRTAWIDLDRRFHLATYAGASPRLRPMIEGFWHGTQKYRRILLQVLDGADYAAYHDEHRLMAHALANGESEAGEELVRMHIARSRRRLAEHRHLFDT